MNGAEATLEDAGFQPEATDALAGAHARRLAACLDAEPARLADGTLPPLWHWAFFGPRARTSELGSDGHPRRRPEMSEFPHRMWVGGRVRIMIPLDLDVEATRSSRIASTAIKEGRSGRFLLMTVAHEIAQRDEIRIAEEQDLVFRAAVADPPSGPDRAAAPEGDWVEQRTFDPVLLFRFSAATNNAHRIHYDHPYATGVEGYPDLVVHGPLTAILLADVAARRLGHDPTEVSFRARAPHFANRTCWLIGGVDSGGGVEVAALRDDHAEAMTLTAR